MKLFFALVFSFAFNSCMSYKNIKITKEASQTIALQSFSSSCCGQCGERVIVDQYVNKIHSLQVNCDFENQYAHLCTPFRLGTQKKILTYKKNKIISETYYKPVYDTISLLKKYPKISRGEYYDTSIKYSNIIPLDKIDSLLIKNYTQMSKSEICTKSQIEFIIGFVKSHEILDKKMLMEKNRKKILRK